VIVSQRHRLDGAYSPFDHEAPAPGAKRVRFGADYVFCDKEWSLETFTAAAEKVCADYGVALPKIVESTCGGSPCIGGYHPGAQRQRYRSRHPRASRITEGKRLKCQ